MTPVDKPQPVTGDRLSVIKAVSGFRVAHEHPYLEKRGIERSTVTSARFMGTVAIDDLGNAIFPHYDQDGLTGYSMKNNNFTGFSSGGTKALWQSNHQKSDRQLLITESAIDALSYHQLFSNENTNTRYIATSGTISNYQLELIKTAMAEMAKLGGSIAIATDNDEMGNKMAKTLSSLAPSKSKVYRHVPQQGKDWNEVIKHERQKKLTRQKRQRSRGLEL
ncbi:MAG: toprim domain-containing protein [Prochloraceae cyanobacterium]